MTGMLTSDEAAARLGVKVSTVYVYVSRGLLESHRAPDGRRSLFAVDDVERLARRSRGGRSVPSRMAVVATSITELRDDGPAYRGHPAAELARTWQPEEVAQLLWRSDAGPWDPVELDVPDGLAPRDRMPLQVVLMGAADTLRSDLRPESVVRTARRVITTLAGAPGIEAEPGEPLSRRLATSCSTVPLRPAVADAVRVAMVLLADHELATSTLAVRVAASTRADLYDALLAGLGTVAGPLHGSAARHVLALLRAAGARGAPAALDDAFRFQGNVASATPPTPTAIRGAPSCSTRSGRSTTPASRSCSSWSSSPLVPTCRSPTSTWRSVRWRSARTWPRTRCQRSSRSHAARGGWRTTSRSSTSPHCASGRVRCT